MANQDRANQDRWRNEERWTRDDDRSGGRDWRSRSDYSRDTSRGSSGGDYGVGRDRDFDDYGRGSEYRDRSDYDYGASNFNRGGRSPNSYGSGPSVDDYDRGGYRGDAFGARSQPYGGGYYGGGQQRGSGDIGYGRNRGDYGGRDTAGWDRGDERFGGGGSFGRQTGWGQDYGGSGGAGTGRYGGTSSDYGRGSVGEGRGSYGRGAWGDRDRFGERDRGDRSFWDRASDEVSSWFGDESAEQRRQQDQFRGRGPKGYSRSGDRIREDVSDRLADDPSVDASEIEVAVSGNEVTLSGTVPSREHRRRAEDVTERVSGVSYVQNNLRVQSTGTIGSTGTTATGTTSSGLTGSTSTGAGSIGQTAFGRDTSTGSTASGTSSAASTASLDPAKTRNTAS